MTPSEIWKLVDGWAWQLQREFVPLLQLMQTREVKTVLEIGTNKGGTSYAFLKLGCDVISIDLHRQYEVKKVEREFPKFKFVKADSQSDNRDLDILHGRTFDMLFIDGDHSYAGVKADNNRFSWHTNPGGLVVFHDAKDSNLHKKQNNGVPQFWKEIRGEKYVEYFDPTEEWGGIGVKFL